MVGDRFLQPAAGRHAEGSETPAIGDRHLNRDLGPAGRPGRPTTRTRLRSAFRPERGDASAVNRDRPVLDRPRGAARSR